MELFSYIYGRWGEKLSVFWRFLFNVGEGFYVVFCGGNWKVCPMGEGLALVNRA